MEIGSLVYLKAAYVFDACSNRMMFDPNKGPFTVERIYQCGEHTRVKAVEPNNPGNYVDANIKAFAPKV